MTKITRERVKKEGTNISKDMKPHGINKLLKKDKIANII